jgi:hypothetical protein
MLGIVKTMDRLSPFFPAMLVFFGALFVALGGFWASYRQSNFNMEIRAKNEEIARLQQESSSAITGGNSFAWVDFQVFALDGSAVNALAMPEDLLLVSVVVHQGKFPLYDVTMRLGDVGKPFDINEAMKTYHVGNLTPGLATSGSVRLTHHGRDLKFNVFFTARNGTWVQFLRKAWIGDGWARANKVVRGADVLFREVSDTFPRKEDRSIDWGEAGAQDAPVDDKRGK